MAGNGGSWEKPKTLVRRLAVAIVATCVVVGVGGAAGADARPLPSTSNRDDGRAGGLDIPRTVVTTDMEQDDLASLIRYMYYTNDVDTEGIVYTAGRYHWAGDGLGTQFFLPGREYATPQTSWRWTGSNIIQDAVIPAYAKVYPNLKSQDAAYPSPASLLAKVEIGNVDFEGEMDHDTAGSNLIKELLLDNDPRPLYLQAWGGTNTIARALKSIEDEYSSSRSWSSVQAKVNKKAVILASGFQDETYANYISKAWPEIKAEQLSAGYSTWGYNCSRGAGNTRGLPADAKYFQGAWIKENIQVGPLGSLYRSWLDGQAMPGDQLDIFGDPAKASSGWCKPLQRYDFLSEGDDVAYMPLLDTGINVPSDPTLGSWGGRATQTTTSPNLWTMVPTELDASGNSIKGYTTSRWEAAAWNDFANRVQWSLKPANWTGANHAPSVAVRGPQTLAVRAGQKVALRASVHDPDGNSVTLKWWQYQEEGTYPGSVTIDSPTSEGTTLTIPADAQKGQTISVILEATDDGTFPLTRYARVILRVT